MSAVRGSVQMKVGGLEFLARNSLIMIRSSSELEDSLEDFKEQERFSITDKQWNFKMLRTQFKQRNMESQYRRYDDKLRLGYLAMFVMIMVIMSLAHLLAVVFTSLDEIEREIISLVCYSLQAFLLIPIMAVLFVERMTDKYKWLRKVLSIVVIIFLVLLDILVPLVSWIENQPSDPLRPAYYTNTLLACYIFLPITEHVLALSMGVFVSICHLLLLWQISYTKTPDSSKYRELGGDILYLIGVNFLGIYYRLMNEIISRRSFLDRRACIESTLKLNYEKEQEERLLLSILPQHVATHVRQDVRNVIQQIDKNDSGLPSEIGSQDLYIREDSNVSILYADIVNYTMISTTLHPKQLVETLNELFAKFDEAAEEHDVLRIKFLGDCYYCVSGVPKPNPQHAKSCVDLGLDMISIIKDVREHRKLNIDMRIGVHSGNILSGIIGINKWQYDIWSKDVTIANRMESTGQAGKVHITKRTLEELNASARDYVIEPNFEAAKDPLLSKYKIETFLISNPSRTSIDYANYSIQYRRASVGIAKKMKKGPQKGGRMSENNQVSVRNRTTAFIDNNLMAYRQMLKNADTEMSSIIDKMPSGMWGGYARDDSTDEENVMWKGTLIFRDLSWEKAFLMQPDLLFKYFVAASLIIFVLMLCIQALTIEIVTWRTWVIDGGLGLLLLILVPLNWTQFIWNKFHGREEPQCGLIRFLYNRSASVVWSATSRSVLYLLISLMLGISSLINLTECGNNTDGSNVTAWTYDGLHINYDENCIAPWHLAQATFLALLLTFLFSRVFFVLKWAVGLIMTSVYIWIVWDLRGDVFLDSASWNYDMDPRIAQTLAVVFLTCTLHLIDRTTEFRRRLDYRWKRKLAEKQEDASTVKMVNNLLLKNILPEHVANIYLDIDRSSADDLYYEVYENVAVMFASLTDYRFVSDDGTETSERTLLKYLSQLISDFDRLLLIANRNRLKVEKIKMAGWTYMAACGLDPNQNDHSIGPRSSVSSDDRYCDGPIRNTQTYEDDLVLTLIKFAAAMNEALHEFNKSSFQGINLKIGISHGLVAAGVVGSSKPLYDIWGHAVNMASRMDSTGEPGKIQVTENTAIVLDRQGVLTQFRGKTFVKGAGYIRTYFVPLDASCNLIYKESNNNPRSSPSPSIRALDENENMTVTQL